MPQLWVSGWSESTGSFSEATKRKKCSAFHEKQKHQMWEKSERMNQYVGWNMNISSDDSTGGFWPPGFMISSRLFRSRLLFWSTGGSAAALSHRRCWYPRSAWMNVHMRVLSPWPRSARYVSGLMWGGGIKTKSGSYREFTLSYFKLACKSVCKQPLVVRPERIPECLSLCYGEDLRRAGSFLKCAYWQSQCHSSMQMSSVRRCFNWVFYFREEEESGWKPGELRYVCKFVAY